MHPVHVIAIYALIVTVPKHNHNRICSLFVVYLEVECGVQCLHNVCEAYTKSPVVL